MPKIRPQATCAAAAHRVFLDAVRWSKGAHFIVDGSAFRIAAEHDDAGAPFPICLVGHAGDGNFHLIYVLDPGSAGELDDARRLNDRMVRRALAMGGTCSGEHGIGIGKMHYLEAEHGAALDVMRTIKRALDPDNRMNPGKMIEAHR